MKQNAKRNQMKILVFLTGCLYKLFLKKRFTPKSKHLTKIFSGATQNIVSKGVHCNFQSILCDFFFFLENDKKNKAYVICL